MTATVRQVLYMVEGDLNPPIDFDIVNDDEVRNPDSNELITPATPFDLTDCTVRFYMKGPDGVVANAAHPVCTILDPLLGQARYIFIPGDTNKPGRYHCDVEVTDVNNHPQTEYTVTELQIREQNG